VSRIVVVGAGTMGAGIAFVAAHAGFAVDVVEPDAAVQDAARARVAEDAEHAGDAGAAGRIEYYSQIIARGDAVAAIEAVPERLEVKQRVFRDLAAALGKQALLATNTSSLPVTEIARGVEAAPRVLGLHFFNPAPRMRLVEIVRAEQTSEETIERARALVEQLKKTGVVTADTPGFVVNRIARPFYLQAMRAYEAGVAPIEDLDRLARGVGFRMGPFELMDLIGLDVNLATSESVYERTGEQRLEPVPLQRQMVAQGKLGRKSGLGFYDYANGPPAHDDGLPALPERKNAEERVVVLGYGEQALEFREYLEKSYAHVALVESGDEAEDVPLDATIVIDTGDGCSDRGSIIETLDELLPPETVIFVDAYATDLDRMAKRLKHPQRIAGYGILSTLEAQTAIEVVDAEATGDDALEMAQELFESIGRRVVLVENETGLFLGRIVCSIVNEAVAAVQSGVAGAEEVDVAMRLGTNYPRGPIEWGREIGGARVARILQRLAGADGAAFAPHRALWVLDVEEGEDLTPETGAGAFPGIDLNG
jgi:3-hydroxybutyryl-CoA dehydrogenase